VIDVSSVSFTYAGAGGPVLDGVSLHVERGALVCLCGANGSGKSTLLSLLAGLFSPVQGTVRVGGHSSPGAERALRAQSALVLQDADLQIIGSTVEEDLLLTTGTAGAAVAAARGMADRFGLGGHWNSPVQTLSYGQKRKLCLAAAALRAPQLLLLDEPFSGLDYPAMCELRGLLRHNAAEGLTQIVSVHDVEPLADMADTMAVLHKGRLALDGAPEAVLEHAEAYGLRVPCSWRTNRTIAPWA